MGNRIDRRGNMVITAIIILKKEQLFRESGTDVRFWYCSLPEKVLLLWWRPSQQIFRGREFQVLNRWRHSPGQGTFKVG